MSINAGASGERSTRVGWRHQELYEFYLAKVEDLEERIKRRRIFVENEYAIGYDGKPRKKTDLDRFVTDDDIWKKLVMDYQFAERHVQQYSAGAIIESNKELLRAIQQLTAIVDQKFSK